MAFPAPHVPWAILFLKIRDTLARAAMGLDAGSHQDAVNGSGKLDSDRSGPVRHASVEVASSRPPECTSKPRGAGAERSDRLPCAATGDARPGAGLPCARGWPRRLRGCGHGPARRRCAGSRRDAGQPPRQRVPTGLEVFLVRPAGRRHGAGDGRARQQQLRPVLSRNRGSEQACRAAVFGRRPAAQDRCAQSHPLSRNCARSTPGGAYQAPSRYLAPSRWATSLLP
jgi:hypothetical protein